MKKIKGFTLHGIVNIINNHNFDRNIDIGFSNSTTINVVNGLKNPNATLRIKVSADTWDFWGDSYGEDVLILLIPVILKRSSYWTDLYEVELTLYEIERHVKDILDDRIPSFLGGASVELIDLPEWATNSSIWKED